MASHHLSTESTLSFSGVLRPFKARFLWAAIFFTVLLATATTGYVVIEGWSWFDALYMSVITATSVGFGEVYPLSNAGRAFTMAILSGSIVGLGIWWALVTALIVEADLGGVIRRRRSMRKIEQLSGHIIICGAGRMGRVIMDELDRAQRDYVLVENDPDRVARLRETVADSVLIVEGDATREHTLRLAGIERAAALSACLSADAENLLLCITARGLRPNLFIVARAEDEESLDKFRRAGATKAISPNITGAVRIATSLLKPSVVSFLDAATLGSDISLRLEEATIPTESALVGSSLADARIPQRTGLIVLAVRNRQARSPRYNPGPSTRLEAGDTMIVLGRPDQLDRLRAYISEAAS